MAAHNDRTTDPAIRAGLLLVQRGTAYFLGKLNQLSDDEFDAPSLLPGWDRRHVIAHVGYNARALTHLTEWAATGIEHPMYASPQERNDEIERGAATLSPSALRRLVEETAENLDREWRGLSDTAWHAEIRTAQGRAVPASTTVWMRTREVWLHAVDLDSGGSYDDFPAEIIDHLLADVLSNWRGRQAAEGIPNFVLAPEDRPAPRAIGDLDDPQAIVLRGSAVNLSRWATGRGDSGVLTASGNPAPAAPRWL